MNKISMRKRRFSCIMAIVIICSLVVDNNIILLASEAVNQINGVSENHILSENDAISADETISEDRQISNNTVSDDKTDEEDTKELSVSENEIVSENEAEIVSENHAGEEESAGVVDTIIESGSTGEISYNIIEKADGNYKLVISGNGKMGDYDINRQDIYGAWYYTTSAPWGKYLNKSIELDLREGCTYIGKYAFYNLSIAGQLNIPTSVTTISNNSFYECNGLNSLNLSEGLVSIGDSAFYGCLGFANQLVLPDSLKTIGKEAFWGCKEFSGELVLPQNMTSIGAKAFRECSGFTGDLVIPSGLTAIEDQTFYGCTGLNGKLTVPGDVNTIEKESFLNTKFKEIDFNEGLEEIKEDAFERYDEYLRDEYPCNLDGSNLLPNSIKSVGHGAFWGCINGNVNIPANLIQIGGGAFDSSEFTGFDVNKDNTKYSDINGVLFNKEKTELLDYPINKDDRFYTIPESVNSLARGAFYNCSNLCSLTIPNGVSFPYDNIIAGEHNSIRYLFMSDSVATKIADPSAIDLSSSLKIYVPENAMGYDVKPWSDYNVLKGGFIKAERIQLSDTDVIRDVNNTPPIVDVVYSVKPSNATAKNIGLVKSSDSTIAYGFTSFNGKGDRIIIIRGSKPGIATITVTTEDGYASATIDVTVVDGGSSGEEDPVTEEEYTVLFKKDGELYEKQVVKHGQTATKPSSDPTKEGYTFVGWANGNSLWNFSTPVTTGLILNAKFTPNTISDNDSSGSGKDPIPTVTADNKIYLVVGQTYSLGEKGYKTSNTKAATVDKNTGKITAKAAEQGNALISNGSKEYLVIVQKPYFSTSNKKVNMLVGRNYKLQLSGIESTHSMFYPISWESSNEKIATVNNGMVTALAKGKANIYAYVGGKKYKAQVVIKDTYSLPSIFSSTQTINVNPLATVNLKYKRKVFVPKNATWTGTKSDKALTEIKNNSGKVIGYKNSVVEIYKNGKVKGIGPGTTTISGKDVNTATVTLTVNVYPVSSKGSVYINKGKSEQLKYAKVDNSKAKWLLNDVETANNGILEISSKGKIKAISSGLTKVSCVYKGFTFETMVYVENPSLTTDEKLTQNGNTWQLSLKKNDVYTIRTKDIYQTPVWSSKNNKTAFVDENGTIYARKSGKATISTKVNGKIIKVALTVSE